MAGGSDAAAHWDASVWLGVGLVGVFVFLLGIWKPALSRLPYSSVVQIVVAIAGGGIAVLGFSRWWDARSDERLHPRRPPLRGRAREIAIAPSFEVYDPRRAGTPSPNPVVPPGEDDGPSR